MTNHIEEPIDEDEQDEILSQAMKDFKNQTMEMCNTLKRVCQVAAIVPILSKFYHDSIPESDERKLLVSIFPFYSSAMHLVVSKLVVQSTSKILQGGEIYRMEEYTSWIGTIIIALTLVGIYTLKVSDTHIWSIAATNLMTFIASSYFIHDTKKTLLAIHDLRSCKYKFKTL
jgi:hypothetical protein